MHGSPHKEIKIQRNSETYLLYMTLSKQAITRELTMWGD